MINFIPTAHAFYRLVELVGTRSHAILGDYAGNIRIYTKNYTSPPLF